MHVFLYAAIAAALSFWVFQGKSYFTARPYIKAGMAVFLAAYCFAAPVAGLWIMALGFALSAAGDFFLDLPDEGETFFTFGLAAFLAGHIAFTAYLAPFASWTPLVCAIIGALCTGFFLWLQLSLPKTLVIPVGTYSAVIAIMGMAAMTTSLPSIWVPIGAALFIASDIVLAIEKFKTSFAYAKTINWGLYASGQILLAVGVVGAV